MRSLFKFLTNRIGIGMIAFFVLVGFWEFKWKPQYRPYYENGISAYKAQNYQEALREFNSAYAIAPNSVDVLVMEGWTNFKLRRFSEARFYFERALKIDPRVEEARIGDSFIALETGRGTLDYQLLSKYLGRRKEDPNVQILAAGALAQEGKNYEAARMYEALLTNSNYGKAARVALDNMYGLEGFNDPAQYDPPQVSKPAQTQVLFRAANGQFMRLGANGWEPFYVAGVNLGPGAPGFFPASPPMDGRTYADWLLRADQLKANVVRAYTLLPPSFYRAFYHYKRAGGKLVLFQQIWVGDPPNKDLYDPKFVQQVKGEIRYAVDALHGNGNVPPQNARGSGIYTNDVAADTAAILLGREIEPSVAVQTNLTNGGKTSFHGRYMDVAQGNATEIWFAEMLDYLIEYEHETYNWQHPVAIVNWPPMDPLSHPTETPIAQEVQYRIRHGEKLAMPKGVEDDNDATSIDEAHFRERPEFFAGMFASYHVYPYYPDFLILDRNYLQARDSRGPNPMAGYIRDLKAHIPHPLIITEYGVPNSIGISHFHPYGWHHGGHTEEQQAQILDEMTRSIQETGCAGGIVFELLDEWYKHNWLTVDFERPLERAALWLNELDPEKKYGLIGFRPSHWKLFSSDPSEWSSVPEIYQGSPKAIGELQSVQAAADEAFLYLRLNGACIDCGRKKDSPQPVYAVALNTLPLRAGLKKLPFGPELTHGANFLLMVQGNTAKLLVSDNYNPYQILPKPGVPNETEISYKPDFHPKLEPYGAFQEMIVETNRRRYGRDGVAYPGQRYSRSIMRYSSTDDHESDSFSEWFDDKKTRSIVVRIPWGKLLVTDPSSHEVFFGFDKDSNLMSSADAGVELSAFVLDAKTGSVKQSLPAGGSLIATPKALNWKNWETVKPEPFLKKAYFTLQKDFAELSSGKTNVVPGRNTGIKPAGVRTGR